jgi:hypothetical protein
MITGLGSLSFLGVAFSAAEHHRVCLSEQEWTCVNPDCCSYENGDFG